jgi:putative tryptophan/tyrosine transport system substrate-binding protein
MGLQMGPKRLELVRQLVPNAAAIAMLFNPSLREAPDEVGDVQDAARVLGIQVNALNASTKSEIDTAFTAIVQQRDEALVVGTDPFLLGQRDQLVLLAARYNVPTIYFLREFVEAGGLMSYGPNIANGYRQAGVYTGQVLGGANPGTLPVMQPTQFVLFINLKTAKELGLIVPPTLLALADEVIE